MMLARIFPAVAFAVAASIGACSILHAAEPQTDDAHNESRSKLWHLVHDICVPAAAKATYPPSPCAEVDAAERAAQGYAVLKDRSGRFQYLVMPLARITGIESPALLAADAPNYFADAWNARFYVEAARHLALPRDALVVIVNSTQGRSQDHLHLHVGCIRPEVRDALRRLLPTLDEQWRTLPQPLPPDGQKYRARWAAGESLSINPFKSLASALSAGDRMALHSLVMTGARSADGQPGFILLSARADAVKGDRGNSDELQDLDCAVADEVAH
ncbi:MAG: CDP-diacylglycerol diphosphatase [Rudaea sp.]|uniref:CDP-diacylglycerol diphosphatase n=1 Tax=unclassified Rudaea TaxID=2627037 RepID=UPI0014858057|nr:MULTISPECIES: CDP-diacylglycerol diphosphatase [unclassified Rudaea]MBN8884988.1 CDP-diacylglycerol diphosphatase [Rudaea sp.]MBR0344875.1 CDP-diacylglycerol diphosphatase [Rudaea sp.]